MEIKAFSIKVWSNFRLALSFFPLSGKASNLAASPKVHPASLGKVIDVRFGGKNIKVVLGVLPGVVEGIEKSTKTLYEAHGRPATENTQGVCIHWDEQRAAAIANYCEMDIPSASLAEHLLITQRQELARIGLDGFLYAGKPPIVGQMFWGKEGKIEIKPQVIPNDRVGLVLVERQ